MNQLKNARKKLIIFANAKREHRVKIAMFLFYLHMFNAHYNDTHSIDVLSF